jgi:PAS domain S-box-containing protein
MLQFQESRVNHSEGLYSLVRLLEAVGSCAPLSRQLDDLALYVERISPDMRCSILLVDEATGTLRFGAGPRLPEAYNRAIDGRAYGEGVGSCGTAAARRATVIVADIQRSPLWIDYRELAAAHGLAACWSTPVIDGRGELLGTFALYYHEPRQPKEAELDILRIVAPLAAVVIQRHRDALRLQESEDRFGSVFEFAAIGMALVSPEGRWLRVNQALCRIVGYSPQELLDTDFLAITHPNDLAADLKLSQELLDGKRAYYAMEKRYFHRDGRIIWILLSVSLVRNEHDKPLYFISQIQDISDRKRLELALGELSSSEQQQLGRDLHDGLGQELTGLSLMARGLATKAQRIDSPLAEDAAALSGTAMLAVSTCRDIVRGVSPLTENKGALEEGLRHLVLRVNQIGKPSMNFVALNEVPMTLNWYSRNQLYRIAQEAIHNALDHAGASRIEITLSVENSAVRLTVADDGRGFTDAARKRGGFGLDTMRYRAAAIHAHFSLESRPGGGTTVTCDCPLPARAES